MINFEDMLNKSPLPFAFHQTECWLMDSGIIHSSGGVSAWFDQRSQQYSYLYPEITGYAITYLVERYESTREEKYLEQARQSAIFLKKVFQENNHQGLPSTIPRENGLNEHSKEQFYSFDLAMITQAFLRLSQHDTNFIPTSLKLYRLLLTDYRQESFISFLGSSSSSHSNWSKVQNLHHAKNLVPIVLKLELEPHAGEHSILETLTSFYFERYRNLSWQKEMLHPTFYYLEGMLRAGHFLKRDEVLHECFLLFNKIINECYLNNTTSDVLAQALRLTLLFEHLQAKEKLQEEIQQELNTRRFSSKMTEENGGLNFWPATATKTHLNSWSAIFWLQAQNWMTHKVSLSGIC